MTNLQIILFLSGLVALFCAIELYKYLRSEIGQLGDEIGKLIAQVEKLKEAQQKRINYTSLIEMENAIATLDALRDDIGREAQFLDAALSHLFKARAPKDKS